VVSWVVAPADNLTELEKIAIAYVYASDAVSRHFNTCTLCSVDTPTVECAEGFALIRARGLIYNALVRAAFGTRSS
jgi:hypothetical protein